MKIKETFKHSVPKKCLNRLDSSKTNICKTCKNKKVCESIMEYNIEKELNKL